MAAKTSFLDEELCCSVCCEIFKDPIILKCSHSFCTACIQQYWERRNSRECPTCRTKSSVLNPPVNRVLKNIVENYLQQKRQGKAVDRTESPVKSNARCSLHGERLLLFCVEDQEAVCVVCQTAKKHKNHHLFPVEEAAKDMKEELKTALNPIKENLDKFIKVKQECEKTVKHIKSQTKNTEKQIKEEFKQLHQFLRDEEVVRLAALREEEERKSQRMKEKIKNISQHVSTLSDNIRAIEKAMGTDDVSFLKTYNKNKERAQCTLQGPELVSGALIDVAKHLGSLKFRVWEKMLGIVQYTPVTLDPNTAAPWVSLSDDLTSVRNNGVQLQLPDNPERFNPCVMVLGSEGFTSGTHSWEVEVGNKPEWDVGVVKESINRKGSITYSPKKGFWVVVLRNGDEYKASGVTALRLKRKPQRIRVQLDYDRGEVSFCDPSNMSHIYTFKDTFTERLFPFFSPYSNNDDSNPGALQICPVMLYLTVTSSGI